MKVADYFFTLCTKWLDYQALQSPPHSETRRNIDKLMHLARDNKLLTNVTRSKT